jgi:hypothetical protein
MPLLWLASVALAQDTGAPANPGPIDLVAWRDDPHPYCIDVSGTSPEPGDRVQVHDCHLRLGEIPPDQEYTTDYPSVGNIYLTQAELCVEARAVAGARLVLAECSSTAARQLWVATEDDGQIHPASDTSLCWAMQTRPTPGTHRRAVTLEPCADVNDRFLAWGIPGGSVGS